MLELEDLLVLTVPLQFGDDLPHSTKPSPALPANTFQDIIGVESIRFVGYLMENFRHFRDSIARSIHDPPTRR